MNRTSVRRLLSLLLAILLLAGLLPTLPRAEVAWGKAESLALRPGTAQRYLLTAKGGEDCDFSCHLRPDITAPVSEGEVMGEMIVTRSAEELARLPLLAAESVERIGFSGIFLKLLGSLAGL